MKDREAQLSTVLGQIEWRADLVRQLLMRQKEEEYKGQVHKVTEQIADLVKEAQSILDGGRPEDA